jgi:nitrate/TMAO reductase-like tetraheme cytochrome c subunit
MNKPVFFAVCLCLCVWVGFSPSFAAGADAGYVGVEECKRCHEEIYKKWERTAHKKALDRIEVKEEEKNPDCLKCHVTAYDAGGYKLGDANAAKFAAVQCEACHGPGSQHVTMMTGGQKKSDEQGIGLTVSPTEETCKKCHKPMMHFKVFKFEEYVRQIDHK